MHSLMYMVWHRENLPIWELSKCSIPVVSFMVDLMFDLTGDVGAPCGHDLRVHHKATTRVYI